LLKLGLGDVRSQRGGSSADNGEGGQFFVRTSFIGGPLAFKPRFWKWMIKKKLIKTTEFASYSAEDASSVAFLCF